MKKLVQLYKKIDLVRSLETEISKKYPEGKMRCPVHLSIGQEAPAVGICSALKKKDQVVSTHRCHAHYIAKGGSIKKNDGRNLWKEHWLCRRKRWINAFIRS